MVTIYSKECIWNTDERYISIESSDRSFNNTNKLWGTGT